MKTQIKPVVAVIIVAVLVLIVGVVYWQVSRPKTMSPAETQELFLKALREIPAENGAQGSSQTAPVPQGQ